MLSVHQPKPTMSSLEISELTGKPHNDVLKDIRRILAEVEIDVGLFSRIYKDSMNRDKPCFNLPRRECDLVIAGYSAKYRLAIIDRWQELEKEKQSSTFIIPQTLSEALLLAGQLAAEKEQALAQIESDKPKVEFAMAVRNLDGNCSIGDFAKVLGIGRNTFFSLLRCDGYLMDSNMPYARYKKYFDVIENNPYSDKNGKTYPSFTTRITGMGQIYFENKYRQHTKKPEQLGKFNSGLNLKS